MAIVKRGSRYQAKVRGSGGTWWTATASTRKAAHAIEAEMRQARELGQSWVHPRDRVVRLTVRRVCERYIEFHEPPRLAKSTRESRARHLEEFVTWAETSTRGALTVAKLKRGLLANWHRSLLERGVSVNSASTYLKAPIAAWKWAWKYDEEEGWEGLIPAPRIPDLPREASRLARAPTWEEADSCLRQMRMRWVWRSAVIQRFTGARISETLALRWVDLDLEREEITFRPKSTKGGYGGRIVPMHKQLGELLSQWPRYATRVCSSYEAHRGGNAANHYAKAWAAAEVAEACWRGQSTHAMRKLVKTELRAAGADSEAVDVLVGHNLRKTTSAYVDSRAWQLIEVVAMIPRMDERPGRRKV